MGVLDGDYLDFGSREEIEIMRPTVTDVKGAASASGEIKFPHEILLGKNPENSFGGRGQNGFKHGLFFQYERPVIGAFPGNPRTFGKDLFDIASGVNRKKPPHGLVIPEFQCPFDDIFFIFLKIETGRVGIPEQRPRHVFFLAHLRNYITVRGEIVDPTRNVTGNSEGKFGVDERP
jgi:hypothetical protein